MIRIHLNRHNVAMAQHGFSMIEVLVTLLVISLALLGTAGLQAYSMRLNQAGQFRTQAVFLVADLAERLEANKAALVGNANLYAVAGNTASAPVAACITAVCTAAQTAANDLAQWQFAVFSALPQASWSVVETTAGNPSVYTITVGWVDRRQERANATGSTGITYETFNAGQQTGINASGTGERFFYTATRTMFN